MDITYYKKYEPVFGSWKIVREIGEGSFGKVFEIEREDFGRTYKAALKAVTIPQSQSEIKSAMADGMDQESVTTYFRGFVEEIVDEFAIMSQLKGHSNVVSYEDHVVVQHDNDIGWDILIRMELLTPLVDYVQQHTLSTDEVVKLGIDMCKALEACRYCHIIHRDIKPENIFVSQLGDYKLGDFGIAKTVEKTMGGLSKKGTYTYMAPEVYKGEEYGPSVDIYSLGIVLYRYLNNNRTPFLKLDTVPTYKEKEKSIIRRINGEELPVPANADEYLAKIILKACAYKPEDRYSSPTEMREDLEAIASGAIPAYVAISVHDDSTVKEPVGSEEPTVPESVERKEPENNNVPDEDLTVNMWGGVQHGAGQNNAAKKNDVTVKEPAGSEEPTVLESVERKEPENSDAGDFDRTASMFVMGVNGSKSNNAAKGEKPVTPPEPKKPKEKPAEPTQEEKPSGETIGVFDRCAEKTVPEPVYKPVKDATNKESGTDAVRDAEFDEVPALDRKTLQYGSEERKAVSGKDHKGKGNKKKKVTISIVTMIILSTVIALSFIIPFDSYVQDLSDETRYEYRTNLYGKILGQSVIDSKGGQAVEFEVYDMDHLKSVRFGDHLLSYSKDGVLIRDDHYYSNGNLKSSRTYDDNGKQIQIESFDANGILYHTKKFELDADGANIVCDYNSSGVRETMIDSSGVMWNYQYDTEGTFLYRSSRTNLSYYWSNDTVDLNMWGTHYAKLSAVAIGCSKISFVRSIYNYTSYEMIGTQYVYIQDIDGNWTYIGNYYAPDEQDVLVEISLDKPTDVCGLAIVPRNNIGPNSFQHKLSEVVSERICYEY